MKVILTFCILLLLCDSSFSYEIPVELRNEELIYSRRASIFFWLVPEAAKLSQTTSAELIRQKWEQYEVKNFLARPISFTAKQDIDGTLNLEYIFRDTGPMEYSWFRIRVPNVFHQEFPNLIRQQLDNKIICDNPELATKLGRVSLTNRKLIGNIAARYGYVATIDSYKVVATPKFFRAGMSETDFRSALSKAVKYYLDDQSFDSLYKRSASDIIAAACDFQQKLQNVDGFQKGTVYTDKNISTEAKESMVNLLKINQWSQHWRLMVCSPEIYSNK